VPASVALDAFTLENSLRDTSGLALVRTRDLTHPEIDLEAAAADRTARGAFTRAATEALAAAEGAEERAVLEEALRYGLQALSGVEIGLR